jgi:predicted amidohydrolase
MRLAERGDALAYDMKTNIRIAQVRAVPEQGNLEGNFEILMSILDDLSREDVDVVVTSECFLDGYIAVEDSVDREGLKAYAIEPSGSPYVDAVSVWARANATWVVFGCNRLTLEGVCNSALLIDREGALVGTYDKTHCQTHDVKYIPGESLPVFDSDFGTFGVLICADRRWPESVRSLALQGARVIFNPTYGMCDDRNRSMMQTRSFESELFIAFTHPIQSLVTGPDGAILCDDVSDEAAYTITEIDLAHVNTVRAGVASHLKDRRTDLYITDPPKPDTSS